MTKFDKYDKCDKSKKCDNRDKSDKHEESDKTLLILQNVTSLTKYDECQKL